jgi:hypothetical protein
MKEFNSKEIEDFILEQAQEKYYDEKDREEERRKTRGDENEEE